MLRIIGGQAKEAVFQGTAYDSVNRSVYTFSSQPLGDAHPTRFVVVAVHEATAAGRVTGVTISGEAASRIVWEGFDLGLWGAVVATGTTGDIVVTRDATGINCAIGIWSIYSLGSTTAHDTDFDASLPAAASLSIDIPAGGVLIVAGHEGSNTGAGTFTWGGGTLTDSDEDYDVAHGGIFGATGASASSLGAATGASVTITNSGGRFVRAVAASWS